MIVVEGGTEAPPLLLVVFFWIVWGAIHPHFFGFVAPLRTRGERLPTPIVFCAATVASIGPCAVAVNLLTAVAVYDGEGAWAIDPLFSYLTCVVHD
jgi:hypothetical protein